MKPTSENTSELQPEVKTKSDILIIHDSPLDIATGKSRKEIHWKNSKIPWSNLVERLSETLRTSETFKEYLALNKQKQDEAKDRGGFVGGYLTGGKRSVDSVKHRQLITLDADFAHTEMWMDFTLAHTNAAAIYSTHKHSIDGPRYRLVIPLDRTVTSEEYEAISRYIASTLGIDFFDPTTFQASRLMYWPSTSKDGVFEFNYQDGVFMSADHILSNYVNWTDSSEWPVCSTEKNFVQSIHNKIKQEDPINKYGIVGDFCRSYSISEAIETFLSDVYESCEIDNRFTYKHGSTAAGLVVYDNKYAFSHHGTDPTSGTLCNAFDLVRKHKFGKLSEEKSNTAMSDFASKDSKVKISMGDKIESARADFLEDQGISETFTSPYSSKDWLAKMETDKKGNYLVTTNNFVLILENDSALYGRIVYDSFANRAIILKSLPWRKVYTSSQLYTDSDDACLRHYIEKLYGISHDNKLRDAVSVILNRNIVHPVREYLKSIEWDGKPRLDTVLIDYLGAEYNEYVKVVTRKALIAAVTRVFRPGVKYDNVLVISGPQGAGKSTLLSKLGGEWFSDSFTTVTGKEALEQLQGVWIIEMGELAGLRAAEVETIKHFISKKEDRFRVAYGRRTESFPRQCAFFGTTNNTNFLKDATGNRRFWPVDIMISKPTKNIFKDLTPDEIDQIWSEAVEYYNNSEELHLSTEIEEYALEVQNEHREQDDRFGPIQAYLDTLVPDNWNDMKIFERRTFFNAFNDEDELNPLGTHLRNQICVAEIWCEVLGGQQKDMTNNNTKSIHNIMKNMPGWKSSKYPKRFSLYGTQRAYERKLSSVNTI